jgi:hypothetical protein
MCSFCTPPIPHLSLKNAHAATQAPSRCVTEYSLGREAGGQNRHHSCFEGPQKTLKNARKTLKNATLCAGFSTFSQLISLHLALNRKLITGHFPFTYVIAEIRQLIRIQNPIFYQLIDIAKCT